MFIAGYRNISNIKYLTTDSWSLLAEELFRLSGDLEGLYVDSRGLT